MTNITLDGLPPKTGTISDSGIIHYREGGVDKKMTVADFLIRISEEYSTDINTLLGAADKVAGRAALEIARRTAVSNADYTILVTDKVVAQIGTMSAARIFSLPTAALYPAGEELIIVDQSGTVTSSNKITVSRASSDTIDGATSIDILSSYGFLKLISDGISKWKISSSSIATTSVAGTVELATNAEVAAGSDSIRAIVPSALASLFGSSLRSTNGYVRLPVKVAGTFVEIICQWGTYIAGTPASTLQTVTLPLAYITENLGVFTQQTQFSGSGAILDVTVETLTISNFTTRSGINGQIMKYFSIGY